ncbi:hypothetical protein IRZ59_04720 [Pseudomonas guariconensis]|uniref:hypothetical protein n=1 Tax=Pseudomonas guariconensis TaxID=1288410 RepID=UPI0018A96929|nr:hypothetical protein [Pseudomonas guariconensis]MBF8729740.1 hypothetical protein [Pseudomonas guariconensis]
MKITSHQKKVWLPLAALFISFCLYLKALGSIWAIVLVIPMFGSLMVFLTSNGDRILKAIKAWLDRDGWK